MQCDAMRSYAMGRNIKAQEQDQCPIGKQEAKFRVAPPKRSRERRDTPLGTRAAT